LPWNERRFKETETPEMKEGNQVHRHFEVRQGKGIPLPPYLRHHEPFMKQLEKLSGRAEVELNAALDTERKPCLSRADNVWWRGKIDFHKYHGRNALLVDYKTGKPKEDVAQLAQYALFMFEQYPAVQKVTALYYWTQTRRSTGVVFTRDMVPTLWEKLAPDLKQYVEAWRTDTWQPRPSGLCPWCPVHECEFWRPKPDYQRAR
jgi:CRISPR/Cas system-associated exonuclease Cas4 (RecB family)